MRTLACLVAVVLAGVPVAAAPILIHDIHTTGLLPVEQLLPTARQPAVDPGSQESAPDVPPPVDRVGLLAPEPLVGAFDAGVSDAMGPAELDAYRSNMTSDILQLVDDDDFAVSHYTLESSAESDEILDERLTLFHLVAAVANADAHPGGTGASGSLDQSDTRRHREVVPAAVSHVQPAALTLAGVCLALAFAGGREWRRRNWHRRHVHRPHAHRRR